MIVTKKIRRTYVVEMTEEQANILINACIVVVDTGNPHIQLCKEGIEVLNDLRESLLNA